MVEVLSTAIFLQMLDERKLANFKLLEREKVKCKSIPLYRAEFRWWEAPRSDAESLARG